MMARPRPRSARGRRYSAQRGSGSMPLALLMLVVALSIGAGFSYIYYQGLHKEGIDEVTLCPKSGPKGHLVLLIDLTDPASMTQMRFARAEIDRQIGSTAVGEMITIGAVTPDEQQREKSFFTICKPPSGQQADALTENARMIEAAYQEKFVQPLEALLTDLMTVSEAPSSPIMENLQELLSRVPGFGGSPSQRLIIFSNLSQHSDVLSFYRGEDWSSFEAKGGISNLARNLSGTEVVLLRLPEPKEQTAILEDFWVNYFEAQGARSVVPLRVGDL